MNKMASVSISVFLDGHEGIVIFSGVEGKKTLMKKREFSLLKEEKDYHEICDVLFGLVYVCIELGHWKDCENYARELRNILRNISDEMIDSRTVLIGSCEYYIGISLFRQNKYVNSFYMYTSALGKFDRDSCRLARSRLYLRLGDCALVISENQRITVERKIAFLYATWRNYSFAAEGFSITQQSSEWMECVRGISLCSLKIDGVNTNTDVSQNNACDFYMRQLRRPDCSDKVHRKFLQSMVELIRKKKINLEKIVKETKLKVREMEKLKEEISKMDNTIERKNKECQLAILHIQTGENLRATRVFEDVTKDVKWSENPNLLSFASALIGSSFLNMGDPMLALPHLRNAEYAFNTPHSQEDYHRIVEKRVQAEKLLEIFERPTKTKRYVASKGHVFNSPVPIGTPSRKRSRDETE